MKSASKHRGEAERLAALRRYGVLDTAEESSFDQVTTLAAQICETPISLVTLLDEDRQWFKSRFGWNDTESSRAVSFCAHAIHEPDLFIIEDATRDDRFRTNPFVTGDPGIRFYAGAPLISSDGNALGTLCVIDRQPRRLKDDHADALRVLRDHVMTLLELRRRDRDLELSESIINSLPGIFYLFDENGRFLRWNRRFEEVAGYSPDDFSRLHPLDLFVGEDQRLIEKHIRIAFEEGATEAEAALVARDGTARSHYFTGRRLVLKGEPYLIGMGIDITMLRDAEEALLESEDRYRTLVESARDAILTVSADGIITSVNHAFEAISGWGADDWLGRSFDGLIHAEDLDVARSALARLGSSEPLPVFEVRVGAKDGTYIPVEITTAEFQQSGRELAAMIVARDIRERKAMDEQLRRMQKLDAIGQLAAGVAHDFNNLLTVILGETDLAHMQGGLPEQAERSLAAIGETAERGQRLTGDLLLLSRDRAFQPEPLDLGQAVTRFVPMLERLLHSGHSLELQLQHDLPLVRADPGMLEQVLMNLVINARDAMETGGQIIISTHRVTLDEADAVRHPDARAGSYACVSVADSGAGVEPEILSQIFEPLFTTKGAGQGTGLGLAIILGIVRRHEGWVELASEVGKGTRFDVYLPLSQ